MIETYLGLLAILVLTAIALCIVAGCGFLLLAMWVAVKERLDQL